MPQLVKEMQTKLCLSQQYGAATVLVITFLIALGASDRFTDVTLTRTLQNCLSYISSHHGLDLGTDLRVAAGGKTHVSDKLPDQRFYA